jgi:HK97 family phage portal protein
MERPNDDTTKQYLVYTIVAQLLIHGEVYIRIKREKGMREKLFTLTKRKVEPDYTSDGLEILSYRVEGLNGVFYTVGKEDMIVLRKPSVFGGVHGDGILENIRDTLDIHHTQGHTHKTMLQKGTIVSGIIETDFDDRESIELAKYGFKQKYEGIANMYETPVLPAGYKYQDIKGQNPRDMDFANMDRAYTEKLLMSFGIPKEVLGVLDGKGVKNGENAWRAFMEYTIKPIAIQIQSQLNEFLIPKLTGDPVFFDLGEVVPQDRDYMLEQAQTALGGHAYMTINEVRSERGLPPVEDGDVVPDNSFDIDFGDDYEDEDPESEEEAEKIMKHHHACKNKDCKHPHHKHDHSKKAMKGGKRVLKEAKHTKRVKLPSHTKKAFRGEQKRQEVMNTSSDKVMDAVQDILHKTRNDRTDKKAKIVVDLVAKVDRKMAKSVIRRMRDQKSFETKSDYNNLFNEKEAIEELEKSIEKILIEVAVAEGIREMALLPSINQFDPKDESLIKEIKRVLRLHGTAYTDTTAKTLTKKLINAGKEGLTTVEMEGVVNEVFDKDYRHKRLGQNLTYSVANKGSLNAYKQSGIVKTKVWHTAEDELVCPLCNGLHGKEIDVHENFFDAGTSVTIKNETFNFFDDVDSGHAHPNCRCKIVAGRIEI